MEGSSRMRLSHKKLFSLALAACAALVMIIMNARVGVGGWGFMRDALSLGSSEDDLLPHDMRRVLAHRDAAAIQSEGRSHDHTDEVRFVLQESSLGAPEFVGRYQDMQAHPIRPHHEAYEVQLGNRVSQQAALSWKGERTVAVGLALTTRNQDNLKPENMATEMPFFKQLLNSFCLTATVGFHYHFYVGHDHSDPFFQQYNNSHAIFAYAFRGVVERACPVGLNVSLHMVECNHTGSPAWAQNDAMMAAYMDNAAYFYRVNDDTLMESTGWTERFVEELERFDPPRVGVVGPWFKEGNVVILTHDFVHRSHIDIFGFYYPRVFTDWFADDWITGVYWPERTRKVPGTKVKHTMERGQRYVARYEKAGQVHVEVEIGKRVLRRYLDRLRNAGRVPEWSADSKLVVAMALDARAGVDQLYGALRYSQLLPIVMPRWRLRVYAEAERPDIPRVLQIVLRKLVNSGVEVVHLPANVSTLPPSLWPFLVADDTEGVERFLIREANTRPSEREEASLSTWLQTDRPFHCVRDFPSHASHPLLPGLVGGIPSRLRSVVGRPWRELLVGSRSAAAFVENVLWPLVQGVCLCHDSVACTRWPGAESFPVLRKDNEFIGQRYDANDQVYAEDDVDIVAWNDSFVRPECVFVGHTGFAEEAVRAVIRHRPVFWSQDYHVTPIMDIKSLLTPIGVKVMDNSLSYHCGQVGTCAQQLRVIRRDNGMRLSPELIQQFHETYRSDPIMQRVTTFVCTLPVAMCEAFASFNRSMIVIATLRYEQARPEPERWHALNRLLTAIHAHPRSILAANNLYDARYLEYFLGVQPLLVPHLCAYLKGESYRPSRKQFLLAPVHSTQLYDSFLTQFDQEVMRRQVDLVLFPLREMYPQYLFSDLSAHPGVVYVPYQVSMVSLTEQYRMNIPLFFPTLELLAKWHVEYQVVRQRTWALYLRKRSAGSAIQGALADDVPDPNNDLDEDAVAYWLKFADFYQWPHIIYFKSVEDLVNKMLNVDLEEISRRMKEHNEKVRGQVHDLWSSILLKVTEGKPIS